MCSKLLTVTQGSEKITLAWNCYIVKVLSVQLLSVEYKTFQVAQMPTLNQLKILTSSNASSVCFMLSDNT